MNQWVGIGNLTSDPELRQTGTGLSVTSFTIAINRRGEGVDYIPVITWGALADNCAKFLKKGSKVCVSGSLQSRSYEVNGQKRTAYEVNAREVEFLNRPQEKEELKEDTTSSDALMGFDDLPF